MPSSDEQLEVYLDRSLGSTVVPAALRELAVYDADDRPVELGTALLIRWDEVLFMEFVSDGEESP